MTRLEKTTICHTYTHSRRALTTCLQSPPAYLHTPIHTLPHTHTHTHTHTHSRRVLATCRQSPLWSGSWSCVALLEASWPLRIPSLCSGIYTYVCVCVYIHMYVRVCICRYIYIYEYMYTCILVRGHVLHCCRPLRVPSLCPGIYIYMYLCAYTYSYIYIYTYIYIYIYRSVVLCCTVGGVMALVYSLLCSGIYICMCVCICIYIYRSVVMCRTTEGHRVFPPYAQVYIYVYICKHHDASNSAT